MIDLLGDGFQTSRGEAGIGEGETGSGYRPHLSGCSSFGMKTIA